MVRSLGAVFWCCALGLSLSTAAAQETIMFEGIPAGTVLSSVFSEGGNGPVVVDGVNPDFPGENAAVIFDSNNPSGGDIDLGTPHATFGGPGIGTSGTAGMPFQNDTTLNNILIVDENLIDANNDGLIDDPDDAVRPGVSLNFDFSAIGPVTIVEIAVLDVEVDENPPRVDLRDAGGSLIMSTLLPQVGDNGVAVVSLGPTSGVTFMDVVINGSGAIDNIVYIPRECGDGNVDPGEECDNGPDNSDTEPNACRTDCTLPECGDGVTDDGEQCDDGNDDDTDGCRNDCTLPECGDGRLDPGEECDDGADNSDTEPNACRTDCTLPECGDGVTDDGEECDDGNENNDDDCRNDCTAPVCGDGIVDDGEQCDDGNDDNNDDCRNDCTAPDCGDGILDDGEECDDGADNSDTEPDACRTDCTLPECGDGVTDDGEECDDGNDDDTDGCRNDCTAPDCGDGVVDDGEECDDGADNSDTEPNACRTDCTLPECGDGVTDDGEECDDGNDNNDDDCRNDCTTICIPELVELFHETFEGYNHFPNQIPAGDPVNKGLALIEEGADEFWYGGRFEQEDGGSINSDLAVQKFGGGSNPTRTGRVEDEAGMLFKINTEGLSQVTLEFEWRTFLAGNSDRFVAGYHVGEIDFGDSRFRDFWDNGPRWDNEWVELLRDKGNSWESESYDIPAGEPCVWIAFWLDGGEKDYGKFDNIRVFSETECPGDEPDPDDGPCGDPDAGSCTEENHSPGCDDADCCDAVCACDPFCCENRWDENCVGPNHYVYGCSVIELCDVPICGNGVVDDGEECDDGNNHNDDNCRNDCTINEGPCGDPHAGSCFYANYTPGCNDGDCCDLVCACDPYCCENKWDRNCAGPNRYVEGCSALDLCGSGHGGGNHGHHDDDDD